MSTTDRTAFEQYAESQGCRDFEYDQNDSQRYRNPFTQREYKYWRAALAWQAEAAKATGTEAEVAPVATKWAIYYDNLGEQPYTSGWMSEWHLYNSEGEARSEIAHYTFSKHYMPRKVQVFLANTATAKAARQPAPVPGLPFADLATPIKEFEARKAAALASPADALVAGDSEPTDTEMLDFVTREKVTIYLETERRKVPLTDGSFDYRYENVPVGWTLGVTSDTFETPRAAIRAAIQAQKDGHG